MKNKRRILALIIVLCTLLSGSVVAFADSDITVYLDDKLLTFDVNPQIIDGRTMVPMRKIFESLGAVVTWDESSRTVTGKKGDTTVNVTIDSNVLFKNSVPKALDVAPVIVDGRTLVPVRAIAESFDCKVEWVAQSRTVKIETGENFDTTKEKLTASEIAERVSQSVFYIEVYDNKKNAVASGSGFFVTSDGVAVTNYHVIEDTSSAQITMTNGDVFRVEQVIAFDKALDIAIIRISKTALSGKTVSGFPDVEMGDSDTIKAGQTIYAIGSPAGLQNTISNGIISNVNRQLEGNSFIQITAAISHGSSGGALVNEYGEVLGITSAGIEDAENIGFAIPINIIKAFDLTTQGKPYNEFLHEDSGFILELSETTVNVAVGETKEVLVYAEGKGKWSIYWDTKQEYIVDCDWGDWLKENESVCNLKITGLREGVATVTVFSNVDFKGVDITVHVTPAKNGYYASEYYPSSKVSVPTYTSVTGDKSTGFKQYEENDLYIYRYYSSDPILKYIEVLMTSGCKLYTTEKDNEATAFYYITPQNRMICIAVSAIYSEVWIYIPR